MKKFFVTFFIIASISGLLFPAKGYAATDGPGFWDVVFHPINTISNTASDIRTIQAGNKHQPISNAAGSALSKANTTLAIAKHKFQIDTENKASPDVIAKDQASLDAAQTASNAALQNYSSTVNAEIQAITAAKAPQCGPLDMFQCFKDAGYWFIELIGNLILSLAAWILWVCGVVFNYSITQLVVNMRTQVDKISAIFDVWQTVRDLANMFFIFILLVISIQTILEIGDWKKMLRNVILVALFLNFSFFFTGAMIDASNIIALQFYNGFSGGSSGDGGMSQKIVNGMHLTGIYGMGNAGLNSAQKNQTGLSAKNGLGQYVIVVLFGSVLMIITAGVFLASSILIVYRFVTLIFLLMFSPLAFAMLVLPAFKEYWSKWWKMLKTQLIFAPVYFMFLWVSLTVVSKMGSLWGNGSNIQGLTSSDTSISGLILSFLIAITLLIFSLTLAKELGAAGADKAGNVAKGFNGYFRNKAVGAGGFMARNTVGKSAFAIANSDMIKNLNKNHPFVGRVFTKPFESAAKQGFGTKLGYEEAMEKRKKALVEQGKYVAETKPMFRKRGESVDDFENRRKEAEQAGKDRKAKFTTVIAGTDNSPLTKIENKLRITKALHSNKEAAAVLEKDNIKNEKEKEAKEKKDTAETTRKNEMEKNQGEINKLEPELAEDLKNLTETLRQQSTIEAKVILASKGKSQDKLASAILEQKKFQVDRAKIEEKKKDVERLKARNEHLEDAAKREKEAADLTKGIADAVAKGGKPGGEGAAPKEPKAKTE